MYEYLLLFRTDFFLVLYSTEYAISNEPPNEIITDVLVHFWATTSKWIQNIAQLEKNWIFKKMPKVRKIIKITCVVCACGTSI